MPNTPQPALSKPFAKANPEIETLASYAQAPPESYWQKWPNTDLPDCPENNQGCSICIDFQALNIASCNSGKTIPLFQIICKIAPLNIQNNTGKIFRLGFKN